MTDDALPFVLDDVSKRPSVSDRRGLEFMIDGNEKKIISPTVELITLADGSSSVPADTITRS